jgi:thiamine pyrophosphate-dependent acetolactate synthase large subunit-like protein
MLNQEAVDVIAENRNGCVVVCTMTTIFTFAQTYPDPLNIRVAPLMGGASSIGLGIALAKPDVKVLVLDGDGSLSMQLGSLLTISEAAPQNLFHFVFNNGVLYEGGGRLPIAGGNRQSFTELARAAGYPVAYSVETTAELADQISTILDGPAPALIRLGIDLPPTPRWSEDNPQMELPDWWFSMMGEDARTVKALLAEL